MKQTLKKKDSLLFAPLSNVGAVSFDKDAVYIDIGRANYTKKENLALEKEEEEDSNDSDSEDERECDADEPAGLLKSLQDVKSGVDEKMEQATLRIFKGSKAVRAGSDDSSDDEESDENVDGKSNFDIEKLTRPFRPRNSSSDSDGDDGSDDEEDIILSNDSSAVMTTKIRTVGMTNRLNWTLHPLATTPCHHGRTILPNVPLNRFSVENPQQSICRSSFMDQQGKQWS